MRLWKDRNQGAPGYPQKGNEDLSRLRPCIHTLMIQIMGRKHMFRKGWPTPWPGEGRTSFMIIL